MWTLDFNFLLNFFSKFYFFFERPNAVYLWSVTPSVSLVNFQSILVRLQIAAEFGLKRIFIVTHNTFGAEWCFAGAFNHCFIMPCLIFWGQLASHAVFQNLQSVDTDESRRRSQTNNFTDHDSWKSVFYKSKQILVCPKEFVSKFWNCACKFVLWWF